MPSPFQSPVTGYRLPRGQLWRHALAVGLIAVDHAHGGRQITAAGDLLINPRHTNVYMKGALRPVVKKRHGRLSEQLAIEQPVAGGFIDWCKHNVLAQVVEPALLPDFEERLAKSGCLSEDYLKGFRTRMRQVADTMRFAMVAGDVGELACGVDARHAHRLGREVVLTCRDPAYHSAFLVLHGLPEASAMAEPILRSLTA